MAVSAVAAAAAGAERVAAAAVMAVGGGGERGRSGRDGGRRRRRREGRGRRRWRWGGAESAVSGECGAGNPRCVCARVWEETRLASRGAGGSTGGGEAGRRRPRGVAGEGRRRAAVGGMDGAKDCERVEARQPGGAVCVCYSSRRRAVTGHEGPAGSLLTYGTWPRPGHRDTGLPETEREEEGEEGEEGVWRYRRRRRRRRAWSAWRLCV